MLIQNINCQIFSTTQNSRYKSFSSHQSNCYDTISLSFKAKERTSMNNSNQNEKRISDSVKKELSCLDSNKKIEYISGLNKMSSLAFAFYQKDDIKDLLDVLLSEVEKENDESLKKGYLILASTVVEVIENDSVDVLQKNKNSKSEDVQNFINRALKYLKK